MSLFQLHLTADMVRKIIADPLFPADPTDADIVAALRRMSDTVPAQANAVRCVNPLDAAIVALLDRPERPSFTTTALHIALVEAGHLTPVGEGDKRTWKELSAAKSRLERWWIETAPRPGTFGKPGTQWQRPMTKAEKIAFIAKAEGRDE